MVEEIEIKRKVFEVVEQIGPRSKKVTRKGETYFLKDFDKDEKGFNDYVDGEHKCRNNGVRTPKMYMFDKNSRIVVTEFIEHKNVMEMLIEGELPEAVYEEAFNMNWFAKKGKFSINFDPENFGFDGEKLYYLAQISRDFSEKWNFEKGSLFLWWYTKDFVNYLMNKGLDIDQKRAKGAQGYTNKQIALMTVKYYK